MITLLMISVTERIFLLDGIKVLSPYVLKQIDSIAKYPNISLFFTTWFVSFWKSYIICYCTFISNHVSFVFLQVYSLAIFLLFKYKNITYHLYGLYHFMSQSWNLLYLILVVPTQLVYYLHLLSILFPIFLCSTFHCLFVPSEFLIKMYSWAGFFSQFKSLFSDRRIQSFLLIMM